MRLFLQDVLERTRCVTNAKGEIFGARNLCEREGGPGKVCSQGRCAPVDFFFSGWVFESITGMVSSFHSGFCLYTLVFQPWRVTVKRNMF